MLVRPLLEEVRHFTDTATAHSCNSAADSVLPPMTFPPCPSPTPLIRWGQPSMHPRNGRQMTTHTGSAIQDLLLRPDSGMSQCASYDSATTMSQMSQAPDTKYYFSDTKRCDISDTNRPRPCPTPATKRHHAGLTNVAPYPLSHASLVGGDVGLRLHRWGELLTLDHVQTR